MLSHYKGEESEAGEDLIRNKGRVWTPYPRQGRSMVLPRKRWEALTGTLLFQWESQGSGRGLGRRDSERREAEGRRQKRKGNKKTGVTEDSKRPRLVYPF